MLLDAARYQNPQDCLTSLLTLTPLSQQVRVHVFFVYSCMISCVCQTVWVQKHFQSSFPISGQLTRTSSSYYNLFKHWRAWKFGVIWAKEKTLILLWSSFWQLLGDDIPPSSDLPSSECEGWGPIFIEHQQCIFKVLFILSQSAEMQQNQISFFFLAN